MHPVNDFDHLAPAIEQPRLDHNARNFDVFGLS
jgi:hypothetical protein